MRPRFVLLMFITLALAGCTGDMDDDPGGTGGGDTSDGSGDQDGSSDGDGQNDTTDDGSDNGTDDDPPPKRDPVTWDVMVQDNSFSPSELTIQAGDTVRFVYDGSNPHTATADNGEFHSGDCPGTDCFSDPVGRDEYTWESAAENIGDVPYYCEIHGGPGGSGMSGTITVLERHDPTPS